MGAALLALLAVAAGGAPVTWLPIGGAGAAAPGPQPTSFVRLGDAVLFQGGSLAEGREPWRSDGTPAGTGPLVDVRPGPQSSDPTDLTALGGRVFFPASDGRARRIWETDGTAAGTRPTTLFPEAEGQSTVWLGADPGRLTVTTSEPEASVWSSDAASPAVKLFGRPCPGPCGVGAVIRIGDRLFAWLFFKSQPGELWRVAGPGAAELAAAPVRRLVGWTASGVFYAREDEGAGLWVATAGDARRVSDADVRGGPVGDAAALGDRLLFAAGGGSTGREAAELWASDGTPEGTGRVADPAPGDPAQLHGFAAAGGRAFFLLDRTGLGAGPWELWASDGTEAGTGALATGLQEVDRLVPLGAAVLFAARGPDGALALWRSDGTAAGTGPVTPLDGPIAALTAVDGADAIHAAEPRHEAWFAGPDGQPWRTDGTAQGTGPVGRASPAGAAPAGLAVLGAAVLLAADDGVHGPEPWRTDGTPGGTQLLADLWPGPGGGAPRGFAASGGRAWFLDAGTPGPTPPDALPDPHVRLWVTDGTAAGTVLRRDAFLGSICFGSPCAAGPVIAGGRAVYAVQDPDTFQSQLWSDDGAAAAPVTGGGGLDPMAWPVTLSDRALFVSGEAVYATDGLAAVPVPAPSPVRALALAGGAPFAAADDPSGAPALWRLDPAGGAPALVRAFPGARAVEGLAGAGGRLYFDVDDPATGPEPWSTDGTADGTAALGDLLPGPAGSGAYGFTVLGHAGHVVFLADDGVHGREPWVTDGTAAGTRLLADLDPGPAGSVGTDARLVPSAEGDLLFFAASDGATGEEPWVTDGTAAGTRRLADLAPGPRSSSPAELTVLGDALLFTAVDPAAGRQLAVLQVSEVRAGPQAGGGGVAATGGGGCASGAAGGGALLAWAVLRLARRPRGHGPGGRDGEGRHRRHGAGP